MKVAVTIWKGRISPVADLTQELLVVDIGGQSITNRHLEHFDNDSLFYRARKLDDLGVKTFICGAISSFYGSLVEGYDIRLISFVHGQVDEVLDAFLNNALVNPRFVMRGYLPDAMRDAHNVMKRYKYLFGPVPSRRFGRSLGVDLTPYKTCSQDCVFCQLGRTTHKTVRRKEYAPLHSVLEEISDWLSADGEADYITLSGSGEPTLHALFGEVLEFIRSKSRLPAVLLTNGSLFHLPEVRDEARHADIVKISLSAWDQPSFVWVNRPHPDLRFDEIIEGQKAFRNQFRGEIWMEVFLIMGMNSTPADVTRISRLAEQIRPDRIHLNTAVRPPAEEFAAPLSRENLTSLTRIFHPAAEVIAEFQAKEGEERHGGLEKIHGMLERRPCTADEIAHVFGMHINEVLKYLGKLAREGRIWIRRVNHSLYYTASNNERCERPPCSEGGTYRRD